MKNSMLNFTPAFVGSTHTNVSTITVGWDSSAVYNLCRKSATFVGQFKDFVRAAYDSYLDKETDLTAFHLYRIAAQHRDQFLNKCDDYDSVFTTDMIAKLTHIHFLGEMLGESAFDRLTELVKVEHDWDDDGAKQMSISSLSLFHKFSRRSEIAPCDLGVFLGFEGEILINWHMHDGKLIDIAFRDDQIEIYTDDGEDFYSPDDSALYEYIERIK